MKNIIIFFIMGLVYLTLEIFSRWTGGWIIGFKVGPMYVSAASLAGWTSLWMLIVGGICGVCIGMMNETFIKKWKMIWQCLIGIIIVWSIELTTGIILNKWLKLAVWDYSHERFNFMGQICLETGAMFFAIIPFVIWLDDALRWAIWRDREVYNPIENYKKIFRYK